MPTFKTSFYLANVLLFIYIFNSEIFSNNNKNNKKLT